MRIKYKGNDLFRIANPLKAFSVNIGRSAVQQTDGGEPDILRPNRISWSTEAGDPLRNSIIMACLMWIQRKFPESPLILKKIDSDGEEEVLRVHPMLDLIEFPNPWYDGTLLWMATLMDWTLDGNAYWVKIRNGHGAPVELWWVPERFMEPKGNRHDPKVFISHYEQTVNGHKTNWKPEDVVHFRFGIDPQNPRKGLSPLKALLREVFTDNEASEFTATLLRNSGVPGLIFIPDTEAFLTREQQLETERSLAKKMYGQNRGRPMVASGKAHIEQFGFDPSQMDMGQIRNVPEERITAVMGIPASVVGLGTGLEQTKVGATQSEARRMAHENAIQPSQRIAGSVLKRQLLPDFEGEQTAKRFFVGFDNSEITVLQEDRTAVMDRLNKAVQGGFMQVGEARMALNLPVEESDKIYLRNFSTVEVRSGVPMAEQDDEPEMNDDEKRLKAMVDEA